jgi:hypothetical protein
MELSQHTKGVLRLLTAVIAVLQQVEPDTPHTERAVLHPDSPKGTQRFAQSLLDSSETTFQQLFRMTKRQFQILVRWLAVNTGLLKSHHVSMEQKVMIFL